MQANSLFQCITCNREVQQAIYSSFQYPDMPLMFSPFILLGILVLVLAVLACRRRGSDPAVLYRTPLLSAAMILGIGMGGFADGIVLHQILQWHEMLSNRIPPLTLTAKSVNMFWDGIFHAVTWMVTLTGIICIWRALGYPGNSRSGFRAFCHLLSQRALPLESCGSLSLHPGSRILSVLARAKVGASGNEAGPSGPPADEYSYKE